MEGIFGRNKEMESLKGFVNSNKNEFVAVYGRRRVGKTFLVRKFFNDDFDFYATGIIEGEKDVQMEAFHNALVRYGHTGSRAKTWIEAFDQLANLLEGKSKTKRGKLAVFIDELPCFDNHRSGFMSALGLFWNSRASWLKKIIFVVCGSATSWMVNNIVNNKGGLHNRITQKIHLRPFTLAQTEEYLKANKFRWPRLSILQMYMVMGGVPYYLSMLDPKLNVPDNIDKLFFSSDRKMEDEYSRLFRSLFKNADGYMNIVQLLSTRRDGFTRQEIADGLKIANNGHLSDMLNDLENCDFIRRYNNGAMQKNGIYQLVDFFAMFHYKFGSKRITDEHFWRNSLGTPEQNTWFGLTFEKVCLCHVKQIVRGLRVDAIRHEYYAWRSKESKPAVQIDLAIDRADNITTICEMKYAKDDYSLTEKEYRNIVRRMETFQSETKYRGGVQACIVTTYGLADNMYSEISPVAVTMDDLFQ